MFVPLNANELVLLALFSEKGGASRAHITLAYQQQSHALKMSETLGVLLAFANKHYGTITTSLLSLQKSTLIKSQSCGFTVHNKCTFMNYTDGEHGTIKIMTKLVSWCLRVLSQTL